MPRFSYKDRWARRDRRTATQKGVFGGTDIKGSIVGCGVVILRSHSLVCSMHVSILRRSLTFLSIHVGTFSGFQLRLCCACFFAEEQANSPTSLQITQRITAEAEAKAKAAGALSSSSDSEPEQDLPQKGHRHKHGHAHSHQSQNHSHQHQTNTNSRPQATGHAGSPSHKPMFSKRQGPPSASPRTAATVASTNASAVYAAAVSMVEGEYVNGVLQLPCSLGCGSKFGNAALRAKHEKKRCKNRMVKCKVCALAFAQWHLHNGICTMALAVT